MSIHDLTIYLGNLLVAGACHLAAWEIGRRIYPRLGPFFEAVLGFIVLGCVAFALGALHVLYRPLLGACLVVPAISGLVHLVRRRPWRSLDIEAGDAAFIAAVVFVLAAIPLALAPVLDHDDNVYHLAFPKTYLALHGIVYLPTLNANMPHLVELLYTFPMALGDFTAAKTLNLFFHIWCLIGLRSLVREELGRAWGGVACLLYLSSPVVQWHLGRGYIEPVLGTFLLAAAIALLRFVRSGEPRLLGLVGLACGAAAATKYQGWVFSLAIFIVAAAAIVSRSASWRSRLVMGARVLVPFGVLVLPWLVKSFVLTGDPFYPMAYRIFGGRDLSEIQVLHLARSFGAWSVLGQSVHDVLVLPLRLMTQPEYLYRPGFSATMMTLVFLAPLLPRSYRPGSRQILGMTFLGLCGWAVSCALGRYLMAWAPLLVLAAMLPLTLLPKRRWAPYGVAVGVVAVAAFQDLRIPVPPALGVTRAEVFRTPRAEILTQNLNYELCALLDREVPPHGKVLGMWENRFYFLDREVIADAVYAAPAGLARLREAGDAKTFADALRAEGVTHVVVGKQSSLDYFEQKMGISLLDERVYPASALDRDHALLLEFFRTQLVPIAENEDALVFRLS